MELDGAAGAMGNSCSRASRYSDGTAHPWVPAPEGGRRATGLLLGASRGCSPAARRWDVAEQEAQAGCWALCLPLSLPALPGGWKWVSCMEAAATQGLGKGRASFLPPKVGARVLEKALRARPGSRAPRLPRGSCRAVLSLAVPCTEVPG